MNCLIYNTVIVIIIIIIIIILSSEQRKPIHSVLFAVSFRLQIKWNK